MNVEILEAHYLHDAPPSAGLIEALSQRTSVTPLMIGRLMDRLPAADIVCVHGLFDAPVSRKLALVHWGNATTVYCVPEGRPDAQFAWAEHVVVSTDAARLRRVGSVLLRQPVDLERLACDESPVHARVACELPLHAATVLGCGNLRTAIGRCVMDAVFQSRGEWHLMCVAGRDRRSLVEQLDKRCPGHYTIVEGDEPDGVALTACSAVCVLEDSSRGGVRLREAAALCRPVAAVPPLINESPTIPFRPIRRAKVAHVAQALRLALETPLSQLQRASDEVRDIRDPDGVAASHLEWLASLPSGRGNVRETSGIP